MANNESNNIFGSDDEDDAPIKSANQEINGNDNSLFGSDDDEEEEEEKKIAIVPKNISEFDLLRAVKSLLDEESIAWSIKNWANKIGEKLGINFTERKDLKDKLMEIVLDQAENFEKRRLKKVSAELDDFSDDDDKYLSQRKDNNKSEEGLDFLSSEHESSQQQSGGESNVIKPKISSHLYLPEVKRFDNDKLLIYTKLPQNIKIQSKPFLPSEYDRKQEIDSFVGGSYKEFEGSTAEDIFSDLSIIRWRYKLTEDGRPMLNSEGVPIRESNAHFVEYKNGEKRLVVGDKQFSIEYYPISNRSILIYH